MLTAASALRGHAAATDFAAQETSFSLEVDRAQELLSLCAQAAHPLVLSGAWVQQQCNATHLEGVLTDCEWGHAEIALHIGGAKLSWHESQVSRTQWRRWRAPMGIRHELLLWDAEAALALSICAPLRAPHCEGAQWRTWMAWIADLPDAPSSHMHFA